MCRPLTLLVLTPSIGGFYFGEVLAGIGREVTAAHGRLVLLQTDSALGTAPVTTPVSWSQIDGAVAVTTAASAGYLQRLRDTGTPVALVSARFADFAAPTAAPDNYGGTAAAVEHLIEHGHTRVGFVGNFAQSDVHDRWLAYVATLQAHGIDADPTLRFEIADNEYDGGETAAAQLTSSPDPPTAVMVATDRNALGLMRAVREAGWRIPDDLAIIGFDNIEAGALSTPPLSSVDQRFDDVGALAARLVLAQLTGHEVTPTTHTLARTDLALRGSCGCSTEQETSAAGGHAIARRSVLDALQSDLRTGDVDRDSAMAASAEAAVSDIDALLALATPADSAAAMRAVRDLTGQPDRLRSITRHIIRYVRTAGGASELTSHDRVAFLERIERLTADLWQLQAAALHRQAELTETALEEQLRVDVQLGGTDGTDPCRLGWLAGTHVRAGILALWEEDHSPARRLRITGTFDADGVLSNLPDGAVTPEEFPPAALIDAASLPDRRACVVVPVDSDRREWGLLAVVGEIRSASTLEPYRHWAAQLSSHLDQQAMQEALRVNEERYALASQATNDGLWEWNVGTDDAFMSERCCALLGLGADDDGHRISAWQARVHAEDRDLLQQYLREVGSGLPRNGSCEFRVRDAEDGYRWLACKAISVTSRGGEAAARVVGSLSDVHEQRCLEEQLRENALHDALTGLPNRRLFLSALDRAIEMWRRSQTPFAVIFLDLDRFKGVNDTLGHPAGDGVLIKASQRIAREVRAVDIAGRFGGDEFAVLLHNVDAAAILEVAHRIQASLEQPIDVAGHPVKISASLGIATSTSDYRDGEDVLRDADLAMYHAKEFRRGTISFFDSSMRRAS